MGCIHTVLVRVTAPNTPVFFFLNYYYRVATNISFARHRTRVQNTMCVQVERLAVKQLVTVDALAALSEQVSETALQDLFRIFVNALVVKLDCLREQLN